jgi:Nitrite/Sulfite reductase ferredoxin-like half domain
MDPVHHQNQDTNDRFLANIQRNGTFSVIPRIAAGEVTPEGLITIGQVAKKYGLYTKVSHPCLSTCAQVVTLSLRSRAVSELICLVPRKLIYRTYGKVR